MGRLRWPAILVPRCVDGKGEAESAACDEVAIVKVLGLDPASVALDD